MFSLHDPLPPALRDSLKEHDEFTAALLARRGITTPEEADTFLFPSYDDHVGDPLTILNMPKAAERIAQAITDKERIAVWSDYDCDGIPGGALFHDFLKKAGANFTNYIPHRHLEGFGLNTNGIDALKKDGVSLIVTVDCGIADVIEVAHANTLGIDVIITDHHLPGETLPSAYAIVDPKQDGETYPFHDFCGGGLAWKVVCAVLAVGFPGRENIPTGWEKWLLDMAALSTIADMVPLLGENRVIAKYGLLVMRKSPRLGLQKLCKAARVNQRYLTEDDVAFMIAPRVNAASRMGNPKDAFELFTTTDEARAEMLARELEKTNRSRRALGAAITRKVHERLETRKAEGTLPEVIVMGDPDWRPGLLGPIASTLADEYERPVFLWGREGGTTLKGSCRAGRKDVSLPRLMEGAADLFEDAGGHAASGGFTVKDDGVFELEERLCEAFRKLPLDENNEDDLRADAHLTGQARPHLMRVDRLAPFGIGNPRPLFILSEVCISKVSWFGKGEEHLRITVLRTLEEGTSSMEAIAFFAKRELGDQCLYLEEGSTRTIVGTLERDQFSRGQPVRLRIIALSS